MTSRKAKESAHMSASDIISTFNDFFTNFPANKSFDMTYKVYLKDLADADEELTSSRRNSELNLTENKPITIASCGFVPQMMSSSTVKNLSLSSSATNFNSEKSEIGSKITMNPAKQVLKGRNTRKKRSMVDLSQINKIFGRDYNPPAPSSKSPPTIYVNLGVIYSSSSSHASDASSISSHTSVSSTFTEKQHEFGKLVPSGTDGSLELFVKVADCFD
ncbi:Membrane-associated kinase regulator [Caenorhabditis elegans]|uniref:Membrane-associated kinase regulator n=1 Tax=Caenorhabditis elegans TaxID=6239 RepID=Q18193_CAEEL|nr:Membrane-associated kinase regulator [Caenorhabditis elegans]CCD65192.1 Membrane-associated kinase regulator [Caenorhabditis elegans]|eukprot:NP_501345.1 Uncharacterized protein CELE_C26B2.2 [Caenorhabditis elegans]